MSQTGEALLSRAAAVDMVIGGPVPFMQDNAQEVTMSGDELERYLSLERVADLTSYSVHSLRDFIRGGDLVAVRWGRAFRVTETELRRFIADRERAEIPEAQRPGAPKPGTQTDGGDL